MKYAITVSAMVPVKQFLVVEAETKEEAIKALEESVTDSVKDSMVIISVEAITEEQFEDILMNENMQELDPTDNPRSLN